MPVSRLNGVLVCDATILARLHLPGICVSGGAAHLCEIRYVDCPALQAKARLVNVMLWFQCLRHELVVTCEEPE